MMFDDIRELSNKHLKVVKCDKSEGNEQMI